MLFPSGVADCAVGNTHLTLPLYYPRPGPVSGVIKELPWPGQLPQRLCPEVTFQT